MFAVVAGHACMGHAGDHAHMAFVALTARMSILPADEIVLHTFDAVRTGDVAIPLPLSVAPDA